MVSHGRGFSPVLVLLTGSLICQEVWFLQLTQCHVLGIISIKLTRPDKNRPERNFIRNKTRENNSVNKYNRVIVLAGNILSCYGD